METTDPIVTALATAATLLVMIQMALGIVRTRREITRAAARAKGVTKSRKQSRQVINRVYGKSCSDLRKLPA